jgi:hypothetical protein
MCRRASLALAAVLVVACSSQAGEPFDALRLQEDTGVIFLAQNVVPDAVMEALFQGRVVEDAAGCLRLDSPDPATVIWPKGFTVAVIGETMIVHSAAGREIGRIGGSFRLGGGEVPSLGEHTGISDADRHRAETHCPGRYWIVGDVP